MDKEIHLLPGFLGRAADWDLIPRSAFLPARLIAHTLSVVPGQGFWSWASDFNRYQWFAGDERQENQPQQEPINHPVSSKLAQRILVGYSLGGRLALHALLQNPERWDAAIVVSAHPGIANEDKRRQRVVSDQAWARRFREDPWDLVMRAWNARNTLASSSFQFDRREADYSREMLAIMLENWSLGRQEDLASRLKALNKPILWVVGERDLAYVQLSKEIELRHLASCVCVVPDAGHRVPWDQGKVFTENMKKFIERVS